MFDSTYNDYIRSILGYPKKPMTNMRFSQVQEDMGYINNSNNIDMEQYYPEIYKLIYPMVNKACINISVPINASIINNVVDEIYNAMESDRETRNNTGGNNRINQVAIQKQEKKQNINTELRDLIKILVIRELSGNKFYRSGYANPENTHFWNPIATQFNSHIFN